MMKRGDIILRMEGIVKTFQAVRALDGVDFDLRAGEIHAFVGENGAGKSTLMNVLAGRFADYGGRITLFGRDVRLTNPRQALALGIGVIYQDLSVPGNLTVAENILLGHEPGGRVSCVLCRSCLGRRALPDAWSGAVPYAGHGPRCKVPRPCPEACGSWDVRCGSAWFCYRTVWQTASVRSLDGRRGGRLRWPAAFEGVTRHRGR